MKIIIFAPNFYDFINNKVEIGGLQTYIRDLAMLLDTESHEVSIVQLNPKIVNGDTRSLGRICIKNIIPTKGNRQKVFDAIASENPNALFILATDQLTINASRYNSIQIQHGIAFDIPGEMIRGFWGKTHALQFINKMMRCVKNVKRFNQARHTVCVDYNYYNWFRTLGTIRSNQNVTVIPNYANQALSAQELEDKISRFNGVKSIVFARRFVDYRGTLLFADIIPDLLEKYPELEITMAGSGSLEQELHRRFDGNPRVHFASFDSTQSLEFHRKFDVAVVPTIFSEGTSLSLCEAMAAGCFPICTHVGGMTNIILDSFNGLSVYPSKEALKKGIESAFDMPSAQFKEIVQNAHRAATTTFAYPHWSKQWLELIHIYTSQE